MILAELRKRLSTLIMYPDPAGMMTRPHPMDINDAREAAHALSGVVAKTPVLECHEANQCLGARLLIKAESLQRTGAFKIRGAYWRMLNMTREERACGAITYSSGNHALGVATAARLLDSSALIVMPDDAPTAKVEAVKALGADVATFNRDIENYDEVVERLRQETGRVHVPPSAHPQVLAGAGTVALEIFDQSAQLNAQPDAILIPCGGGGLTASTAIMAHALSHANKVYAVEPEQFDDTCKSLKAGERLPNPKGRQTICDAIKTQIPNEVTFPINLDLLAGGLTVSDDEVRAAMRFAFDHYKIVVEPGAAVGIAAALFGRIDIADKTIVTVVTGGNIDMDRICSLIRAD